MKILCFAHLSEQLGTHELDLDLGSTTVADFRLEMKRRYPELLLDHVMIAVNEQFADDQDQIGPNDTVALLPPVSGG
ncbi:molybdopterin synthase sulfur carrier subunit [Paenibacillus sp. J45TS6]|uniref:Molybdopterin converting factor subunit 1 n=1 Tax=Paenibacillus gallinarum TaxID=2762232 RepID=A0ABR8ST75_9BACL|nr:MULTISPECIES: molybdopterin converting factor subunit 1 [Paenibacillus]MBD7966691.1 molybdopterin converting factor subunit 1 [Paenibacillus gallinarum]GIP44422.1 molybdopterin synthase sulfur carrier subunit [Paenibacillus sp. J45TS6]